MATVTAEVQTVARDTRGVRGGPREIVAIRETVEILVPRAILADPGDREPPGPSVPDGDSDSEPIRRTKIFKAELVWHH